MKKVLIPLGILVALIFVYFFVIGTDQNTSSTDRPMSDFAIKDTAAVDQVKITDPNGSTITVQRRMNPEVWKLNDGQFNAREDAIKLILETAYRIKVRQEVSPSAMNNIITQIAGRNKKVEFFKDGEDTPFKVYYVGNATADKLGTYMLLKVGNQKSNVPYIMEKPGMYGHLDSRFFADLNEWRSPAVFKYKRGEIAEIMMTFTEEPASSHKVVVSKLGDVALFDYTGTEVDSFDIGAVRNYVTAMQKLNYEGFNKELSVVEVDSLLKSRPYYEVSVTDIKGVTKKVTLHRKAAPAGMLDYKGDQIQWDKDYWGVVEGSDDLMKLQFFSWGTIFKPISFFTSK